MGLGDLSVYKGSMWGIFYIYIVQYLTLFYMRKLISTYFSP